MRPRLRAQRGPRDAHRRGALEFLRLRGHQRHARLPSLPGLKPGRCTSSARWPYLAAFPGQSPDLLRLVAARPELFPCLLQSTLQGKQGRYDLLFADPGERLVLWPDGRLEGPHAGDDGFLAALDRWFHAERRDLPDDRVPGPFAGGWILYLGYELAAEIEPVLSLPPPHRPVAIAVRVPAAIVLDHQAGRILVVDEQKDPVRLRELLHLAQGCTAACAPVPETPLPGGACREEPPERYLEGVRRVLHYIREGDVFQVNLSRQWWIDYRTAPDPVRVYGALRRANPGPFNGLALFDDFALLSSSPERLVEVHGPVIRTRPIAGTRPRGRHPEDDLRLRAELHAHPKERAEHVMLIDLERNDLGRVCRPGSVRVSECMALETYAHVHHIVSEVRGRLKEGTTPGDVIRALFPGGTITGCPKVRCMEIIAELEERPRGAYTGALGYLDRRGRLDLNILIRTLVQEGDRLHFRAGAGIVADSDPGRELEETRAKARGLLRALGMA
ncbi:MAG: aminodeoxychorismate synthase component I [Gammaproteobacteria bacterium]|nr:MAG: aminodeoxychorismate synthase component I [Gammaproteobacteria bacterium]